MKKKFIVLVGPTASGKTEAADVLAGKYPLEIISADSRQVYRFMDIGTGKSSDKKSHKLIDVVDPDEPFSVADYKIMAERAMQGSFKKGKIPFIVGGSGLYVRALVDGLCPAPKADRDIREGLVSEAGKYGAQRLYKRLEKVDRKTAQKIHPNDTRRIIRALEVFMLTGTPISDLQKRTEKSEYDIFMIGIRWPRHILYKRIEDRCEDMFNKGIEREVRDLLERGYGEHLKSMDGLGYKEIIGFLKKKHSLSETKRLIMRNTRRYAKRQMTWFRKDPRIKWVEIGEKDIKYAIGEIANCIDKFIYI